MSSREIVPGNVVKSPDILSPVITSDDGDAGLHTDEAATVRTLLIKFRPSMLIGTVLFSSGLFHLSLLWFTGADWSGPLSLRKPGLFGVSAGVTVWSIAWVLTQLQPRRHDHRWATWMSGGLLVEVGLITLQQWRGVASHFNHATLLDATIEALMLGLILLVTAGIAWLCWRAQRLRAMLESHAIAIRAGLWLLLVSCVLGLFVTVAGEINIANGRAPEIWGAAGVLKYPHGAVLHAIQTLPLLSIMLCWFQVPRAAWLIRAAVASHVLFLVQAVWQTLNGRARTDVDAISLVLLAASGLLILIPVIALLSRAWILAIGRWSASRSR